MSSVMVLGVDLLPAKGIGRRHTELYAFAPLRSIRVAEAAAASPRE